MGVGYGELLRTPGVARVLFAQLLARLPTGMLSLSLLLHTERTETATSEVWLLRVRAGVTRSSPAHAAGVVEQLVVLAGSCRVEYDGKVVQAGPGGHLAWPADVPHSYTALGQTDLRAINVILTPS